MCIINNDQEKYHFLNICNLYRYARFLEAQLQILLLGKIMGIAQKNNAQVYKLKQNGLSPTNGRICISGWSSAAVYHYYVPSQEWI